MVTKIPAGAVQLRTAFQQQREARRNSTLEKVQAAATALDSAAAEAAQPTADTPGVVRVEVQQPWRVSGWLWAGGLGVIGISGQGITVLFSAPSFS